MDATPGTTLNHGGTGLQVWLPVRSGDKRSHPLQMCIMLNSRGERKTKALERTEIEQQTPSKWGWETRESKLLRPPTLHEFTMSSVALGDYPRWGDWPLINLIPCIIMIWFDSSVTVINPSPTELVSLSSEKKSLSNKSGWTNSFWLF